ncbi:energy transducer TonB [Marinilabilia salmonicolor]|uniref:TonB family protein n=1 Tax=Marinilabilia salmonicolor TaxID=989 RepID=A0A368VBQ6_9BACT|nr:energy transducer TonB [Marinilabilia salmonicolor]RCW38552.1 TonB family protein [Marinilabilia salmonicolor]
MNLFKICILIIALGYSEGIYCQKDSTYCDCLPDSINAFTWYEELPSFPGGSEAVSEYIKESIKYPEKAIGNLLEDRVYVRICISETGKVENAAISKGKYEMLNKEALRVVSQMPDWKPAFLRGRSVCCPYTLPVNFKIDRITKRKIRQERRTK